MPKYVRENGAIKVIPDDQTTKDGEIDLAPSRKIIDEGNVVIEGRNDGSTVIREKRVSDHNFLSNPRIVSGPIGPYDRSVYDPLTDSHIFFKTNVSTFVVTNANDFTDSYTLDAENHGPNAVRNILPLPSYNLLYILSDSEIQIYEVNDSTEEYEFSRSISLDIGVCSGLIPFEYLGKCMVTDPNSFQFVDIVNETVSTPVDGLDFGEFTGTAQTYTRTDRVIISYFRGDSTLVDPVNESAISFSESTLPSYGSIEYLPRVDKYVGLQGNYFESIDGKTLQRDQISVDTSKVDSFMNTVLEDQFILNAPTGGSSSFFTLIDGDTLNIIKKIKLSEITDIDDGVRQVSFDPSRNEIAFSLQARSEDSFGKIDYNPFYS